MKYIPILSVIAMALAACVNEPNPLEPAQDAERQFSPNALILDGANGGNEGFYFLPPLVSDPTPTGGDFDPRYISAVVMEICHLSGTDCDGAPVAVFKGDGSLPVGRTLQLNSKKENYLAAWKAEADGLFRATVSVNGLELGYIDIRIVAQAKGGKGKGSALPTFKKGERVPIKFRIEDSVPGVAIVGAEGGSLSSGDGFLQLTIPQGALSDDQVVAVVRSAAQPEVDETMQLLGLGYEFLPHGLQLSVPATVVLDLTPALALIPTGFGPDDIGIWHWSALDEFVANTATIFESSGNLVSFRLSHFSGGALYVGEDAPNFFWVGPQVTWQLIETKESRDLLVDRDRVRAAFKLWQDEQDALTFVEVPDAATDVPEIIIEVGGRSDGFCSRAALSDDLGVMCAPAYGGLTEAHQVSILISTSLGTYDYKVTDHVLRHEIGHALGLGHKKRAGAVMEVSGAFPTTLQPWDIQKLCVLYECEHFCTTGLSQINPPGYTPLRPTAVNDRGHVVGNTGGWPDAVAFLWNGDYSELPTPVHPSRGWRGSVATDINNQGIIVGTAWFYVPFADTHAASACAAVWHANSDPVPVDPACLDPDMFSNDNILAYGLAINDAGTIVAQTRAGRHVVLLGTLRFELNPLAGYEGTVIRGITESGKVLGFSGTDYIYQRMTVWDGPSPTDLGLNGNNLFGMSATGLPLILEGESVPTWYSRDGVRLAALGEGGVGLGASYASIRQVPNAAIIADFANELVEEIPVPWTPSGVPLRTTWWSQYAAIGRDDDYNWFSWCFR